MAQSKRSRFGHRRKIIVLTLYCLAMAMAMPAGCAGKNTAKLQERVRNMSDQELWINYRGLNEKMKGIEHSMNSQEDQYQYDNKHWVYSTPFSPGGEGYRLMEEKRMIEAEMRKRNLLP